MCNYVLFESIHFVVFLELYGRSVSQIQFKTFQNAIMENARANVKLMDPCLRDA